MKIIVAGLGKVGWAAAGQLLNEGHEVIGIDKNGDRVEQAMDNMDLIAVRGSAADREVLLNAGAESVDILIAATASDELNLVSCMVGRRLGVSHTVARVRDTSYLRQAAFMRESFGLSRLINPELEAACEISRLLQLPGATRVDSLAGGSIELAECHLTADSPLLAGTLSQLGEKYRGKVLICAVERDRRAMIPKGDFRLQAGDRITVAAASANLRAFFKTAGTDHPAARSVLLLGGSRTAIYLARLLAEQGVRVRIIEEDMARCSELAQLLPGAEIIHGNGSSPELLQEAGLERVDGFVALTGSDEENLVMALYAKSRCSGKIIAKVNHEELIQLMDATPVDCFIHPSRLMLDQLMQYVRSIQNARDGSVEALRCLAGGEVEALEFQVPADFRYLEQPLRDLPLRREVLIAAVTRGGRVILPDGGTCLQAGDRAVVVTTRNGLGRIDNILTENNA